MLDAPFTLLVTHPVAFTVLMLALYALCYVPALLMRKDTPAPTQAFLESFAGPAYTPVWDFTTMPARVPAPHTMVTGYAATGDYVQARTQELFEAACAAVEAYSAPVTQPALPVWGYKGSVDNVPTPLTGVIAELEKMVASADEDGSSWTYTDLDWAQVAEESLTHTKHTPVVKIQHVVSSTERMRAQRAAYAAQGLTARGTKPQPMCEGITKNGSPCKRRAQVGTTTCTLEHARSEEALALWL